MRIRHSRYLIIVIAAVTLNASKAVDGVFSAEIVKFVLPGNSMGYLPLFVAVHRGFFRDEGLEIELPRLVPAMAHNALIAGELSITVSRIRDCGLRRADCR
jgi:ABC-type nitrate/sulfonate/bicarbonate transport system substrate-binding protein